MTIGLVFSDWILLAFGASESSLIYAQEYLNIILIGAIPNLVAYTLNCVIRSSGNPRLASIIMCTGCLMNIVLDGLFIFGFGMGIAGAATATVIAQFTTAIWGITYFLRGKSTLHFRTSSLRLKKAVLLPIVGIGQGAQPIIGFNYGAKQYKRVSHTLKLVIISTSILLVSIYALIQFIPATLVSPYCGDNAALVTLAADGLRKYTMLFPLIGTCITGIGFMQAIGKAKKAMVLSLLRQVVFLIPMLLILPRFLALDGVWFAQPAADGITFFITAFVLYREVKSFSKLPVHHETKIIDPGFSES